jgi:hypothetical protein
LTNTLQGGTIEGNAADDALMVDQGRGTPAPILTQIRYDQKWVIFSPQTDL